MRHYTYTITKKINVKSTNLPKPVMGDSVEVMELYYTDRIASFSEMLTHLNILNDASEIEFLCKEIIEAREIMSTIANKQKQLA